MTKAKTAITIAATAFGTVALIWATPIIIHYGTGQPDNPPLTAGAPESWYSENTTYQHTIETKSEYATAYKNCTLQVSKDGTGTDPVSFWLYMECGSEQGVPSTYGNATTRFHFMTVPADFAASWTHGSFCEMTLTHVNSHNVTSDSNFYTSSDVDIYCNNRW